MEKKIKNKLTGKGLFASTMLFILYCGISIFTLWALILPIQAVVMLGFMMGYMFNTITREYFQAFKN